MSSKRKNTPTKLAKDVEMMLQKDVIENGSDGDSHIDSDSDMSDSAIPLHIASRQDSNFDDVPDSVASPTSSDPGRPQSKKERILNSVRNSESSSDEQDDFGGETVPHLNNNLTKPGSGLNSRKSVDHILKRLNPTAAEVEDGEGNVLDSVKAVLSTSTSVEDQQKRLGDMIAQLQSLKDNLAKGDSGVSTCTKCEMLPAWCLSIS